MKLDLYFKCGEKRRFYPLTALSHLIPCFIVTMQELNLCVCVQEEEFNWLLKEEVHAVLKQLQDVLKVKTDCHACICIWGVGMQLKSAHY